MRAKRWLSFLGVAAIFVAAGLWGAGAILPAEQTVIRGMFIKAAPGEVWNTLTQYERAPSWDAGTTAAHRLADKDGKPVWSLTGPNGHETVLLVEDEQPQTVHLVRMIEGTRFFEAAWLFQLTPQPTGTFIKLTQTSRISNPLMRFIAARFHLLDSGMKHYLKAVGRKFDQTPAIEELVA